jgi:hypothetical protein
MAAAAASPAKHQLQERVLLYQYDHLLQVCAAAVTAGAVEDKHSLLHGMSAACAPACQPKLGLCITLLQSAGHAAQTIQALSGRH